MKTAFDPYRTLQVVPEAEPDVIRAAFRTLARKRHPDVGGSEVAMAELNEAWALLRDRHRRANFDRDRATATVIEAARAEQQAAATVQQAQKAATPPTGSAWTTRAATGAMSSGTVLDFGRYQGRTLGELAVCDPEYLEWLVRTRIGNRFRHEVERLFATTRLATAGGPPPRRGLFSRA